MKTLKSFRATVLCAAVLLALTLAPAAFGQFQRSIDPPKSNKQFLLAFQNAVDEATKSTVSVLCDGKQVSLGTIVGTDGFILTKNSQLTGDKITCKLKDGRTFDAKVIGVKDDFDLAMLKIDPKGLPAVKLISSKEAPVGNWLASAGTGDDPIAVGVMSVASRNLGRDGPRDTRNPKRGFLGIQMKPAENGVTITDVTRRSPASKAGLKVDDKIVAVEGELIDSPDAMQQAMSKTKAGDTITLKIMRGDKEVELKATLEKVPADRADVQNNMGTDVAPLSDRRNGFPTFFQHDSLVPAKECGGPVCDLDGHVVGINIARVGRTETYAIPSEVITPLLADLESGKLAPKAEPAKLEPSKEKKVSEMKAALKKAEEESAAAEKQLTEAKETLKKQEAAKAEAEKKLKEAKEALEKAEKEAKEKK
jgi:serine protease Do